jgi:hypothetical protein
MRDLLTLMGYEWKKILFRKGTVLVLIVAFGTACFGQISMLFGPFSQLDKPWQAMRNNREHARALSGREIDGRFLYETVHNINTEYDQSQPPVTGISPMFRAFGEPANPFDAATFYDDRRSNVENGMREFMPINRISERGVQWVVRLHHRIPTPWVFEYAGGFLLFFDLTQAVAMMLFFVIAISLAPLFSTEHRTGVAQVLLTSKYGKSKLLWAKILTAAFFGVAVALIFSLCTLGINLAAYGTDGAGAMFQLAEHFIIYRLNMAQASVIYIINLVFRAIFFSAFVAFLSALTKSSFITMIISVGYMSLSMFSVRLPFESLWVHNVNRLVLDFIPTAPYPGFSVFSIFPYEIFGLLVAPYIFEPIFSLIVGVGLLLGAKWVFSRYQVK